MSTPAQTEKAQTPALLEGLEARERRRRERQAREQRREQQRIEALEAELREARSHLATQALEATRHERKRVERLAAAGVPLAVLRKEPTRAQLTSRLKSLEREIKILTDSHADVLAQLERLPA